MSMAAMMANASPGGCLRQPDRHAVMFTSFQSYHGLASKLFCGILVIGLGFAAPAAVAAGGDESGATGANAGGSRSGGAGIEKKPQRGVNKTDLTTCAPGEIW